MSYREVGMVEVKEVLRLWLAGVPKKRIAKTVGVDAKTVRRYVELAAEQGMVPGTGEGGITDERLHGVYLALNTAPGRSHGAGWGSCVEQRSFIEGKLKAGIKLQKIRRLLARNGVVIPYWTLRRFAMAELDFGGGALTIPVVEGSPGEELQLDTGWVGALGPDLTGRKLGLTRFR
jgi:hypothetical protein